MNRPINAALIGYGLAGQVFHAPLIRSVSGLRLVTIVSSKPEKVKSDWPEIWVSESIEEVMAHPEIDLVVIATPNQTHFELAQRALQAGTCSSGQAVYHSCKRGQSPGQPGCSVG